MRIIGIMSGTSYDAIDVACADITHDGPDIVLRPRGSITEPYTPEVRNMIAAVLPPAATTIGAVAQLDTMLGQAFARAAVRANDELASGGADLVVSHGQTVFHWVDAGVAHGTLQLGQPAWIAEETGLPVVSDLRSTDIAAGGQGAPLVPLFDALWLSTTDIPHGALNLGGIANITIVSPNEPVLGYDIGPANALIDAACVAFTDRPFDADGSLAARGTVDAALLDTLLDEPFYAAVPPKSTGKELFHLAYLRNRIGDAPSARDIKDVIATLTELTAVLVSREADRYGLRRVIASGGGTRNPVMIDRIRHHLNGYCELSMSDELGIPSADKEAYAFALLGYLTWHGIAGTLPSVTGAAEPRVLGRLNLLATSARLPRPSGFRPERLHVVQ